MLKNILKTNGAQQLSKNELQTIKGGKNPICIGSGTGGINTVGHSSACNGYAGPCTINGYAAQCSSVKNDQFWFY